jgi:uncharacterized cupredoxin-like copper-binding protein
VTTSLPSPEGSAEEILRSRFARGEIDEVKYREVAAVLRASAPTRVWKLTRFWAFGLVGVLVLLAIGLVGPIIATGTAGGFLAGRSSCNVPALTGSVVDVRLWDMMGGGMMGGGMMGGGMMGGGPIGGSGMMADGMMTVSISPSVAPAGEVSFRVVNAGGMIHEFLVLPLPARQAIGARPVGFDGKVSETGSVGEASKSCGEGAGDGIVPGATGWVTLQLPAGRYELICNLPGHYAMGMYTELDVT